MIIVAQAVVAIPTGVTISAFMHQLDLEKTRQVARHCGDRYESGAHHEMPGQLQARAKLVAALTKGVNAGELAGLSVAALRRRAEVLGVDADDDDGGKAGGGAAAPAAGGGGFLDSLHAFLHGVPDARGAVQRTAAATAFEVRAVHPRLVSHGVLHGTVAL